jgi:hypothetical protein
MTEGEKKVEQKCPHKGCEKTPDEHVVAGTVVSFRDWHAWDKFTR